MDIPCVPCFSRKGENCTFVFLDCFGFSEAVYESERNRGKILDFSEDISILWQSIIAKVQKNQNACLISDSFFLVLKNNESKHQIARDLSLLARVIFDFLSVGFIFSGAITAGNIYLEKGVFLGTPIVEAVSIQKKEHMPKVCIGGGNITASLQKYIFHRYGKFYFDYISFLIDRPCVSNLSNTCEVFKFLFVDKVKRTLPKKVLRKYRFFFHALSKNKRICRIHDFSEEEKTIASWM